MLMQREDSGEIEYTVASRAGSRWTRSANSPAPTIEQARVEPEAAAALTSYDKT